MSDPVSDKDDTTTSNTRHRLVWPQAHHCSARLGAQPHCWHGTMVLLCMPPIDVMVCCHCGRERQERQTDGRAGHGPYCP